MLRRVDNSSDGLSPDLEVHFIDSDTALWKSEYDGSTVALYAIVEGRVIVYALGKTFLERLLEEMAADA